MRILSEVYDRLALSDAPQPCDLIFVLAGRECRKHCGLQMFAEGWASALLLSVGRFEIRGFAAYKFSASIDLDAMASAIPPERRHFFVTTTRTDVKAELIAWRRFGTWREIRGLTEWLRRYETVQAVTIISSGFHLRRVRWCCRKLLPRRINARFLAVPSELPGFNRTQWWRSPTSRSLVLKELGKLVVYPILFATYPSA